MGRAADFGRKHKTGKTYSFPDHLQTAPEHFSDDLGAFHVTIDMDGAISSARHVSTIEELRELFRAGYPAYANWADALKARRDGENVIVNSVPSGAKKVQNTAKKTRG